MMLVIFLFIVSFLIYNSKNDSEKEIVPIKSEIEVISIESKKLEQLTGILKSYN